jgi:hypothetical protein
MTFSLAVPGALKELVPYLRGVVTAIAAGWNVEHRPEGTHNFQTAQTTVGSAGSGTALPATPTGYFVVRVNGSEVVVPYYDKE